MNGLPTAKDERPLKDYTVLEYLLLGDLRDLLEEGVSEQNSRWIVVVLEGLLEALPNAFRIKMQGGYLEDVLLDHPNWEPHVFRLEVEYEDLCRQLEDLRDRILSGSSVTKVTDLLRLELMEWMNALQAYHRHERRIVQTAVNLEVGCGD